MSGTVVTCSSCGALVGHGDSFCSVCGSPVRFAAPGPVPSSEAETLTVPQYRPALASALLPAPVLGRRRTGRVVAAVVGAIALIAAGAGGTLATRQAGWGPFAPAGQVAAATAEGASAPATTDMALAPSSRVPGPTVTSAPAAVPPSSSTIATTAPVTPATTTSAAGGEPRAVAGVRCTSGGDGFRGTVTGVQDWVTMRSTPAINGTEITKVPVHAVLVYFPDSFVSTPDFEWSEVSVDGRCGWITSKFIADDTGRVVGSFDAIDYVHRSLRGLEPEALHARVRPRDPGDPESAYVPFDGAADLAPVEARLRQLYLDDPTIDSAPDPRIPPDPASGVPGCTMGDYQHCGVVLTRGTGEVVGYVQVSFVGDGVTAADLDLA